MQTAPLDFRLATRADEELLIALMREFYAEDRIDFDDALSVLDGRLGPPSSGRAQADFALLEGATQVIAYPVSVSRFAHTNSVSLLLVRSTRT